MGCDGWLNAGIEDYRNFEDTIKLYDWAFTDFSYRNIVDTGEPVYELDVKLSQDNAKAVLYPQQGLRVLLPRDTSDDDIDLARTEYMKQQLKTFFSNRWVIGILVVVLLILALYVTLQIRYRKARQKYLEERREAEKRRRQRQRELEEKRRAGWEL